MISMHVYYYCTVEIWLFRISGAIHFHIYLCRAVAQGSWLLPLNEGYYKSGALSFLASIASSLYITGSDPWLRYACVQWSSIVNFFPFNSESPLTDLCNVGFDSLVPIDDVSLSFWANANTTPISICEWKKKKKRVKLHQYGYRSHLFKHVLPFSMRVSM